jgi:hypothetical protein
MSVTQYLESSIARIGTIIKFCFAIVGIPDALYSREPHPLFISYACATLLIQISAYMRAHREAGKPLLGFLYQMR